jgi:hypothetical protein
MTVKITKPELNVREKISELDKPTGIAGQAILAAETPQEQFNLIGAGRRNLIINGDFGIAHRTTSSSSSNLNGYTSLDRFYVNNSGGTSSQTQQTFTNGQTEVPGFPKHYYTFASTVGNNNQGFHQRIEDVRTLAGETVTMSFWAKGTNPAGGEFTSSWIQDFGSGGSSSVEQAATGNASGGIVLTPNWKKYSFTYTVPSASGKTIGSDSFTWVEVIRQPGTDTGTTAWTADIANVQLEYGTVATPFEYRHFGEELALCQRYYEEGLGYWNAGGSGYMREHMPFIIQKRAAPAVAVYSSVNLEDPTDGTVNQFYQQNTSKAGLSASKVSRYSYRADIANNAYTGNIDVYWGWTADAEL